MPAEEIGYYFTEKDRLLFQLLKKQLLAELGSGETYANLLSMAPEVLVAALPEGEEIPAAVGDNPGVNVCNIYKVFSTEVVTLATLTVRTNDTIGVLTIGGTHTIKKNFVIKIYWGNKQRTKVVVSQISESDPQVILIKYGQGDVLPDEGSVVKVVYATTEITLIDSDTENSSAQTRAQQEVFNINRSPISKGVAPPRFFPVMRDKFGTFLAMSPAAGVKAYILQPKTDIAGSTGSSGQWLTEESTLWVLKESDGGDQLEYELDADDEKVEIQARNLLYYDIKGSVFDITTSSDQVPQICFGTQDENGTIWIIAANPPNKARFVVFSLPSGGLTTSESAKTGCVVIQAIDGYSPGTTVTVKNKLTSGVNYQYYGDEGAVGQAYLNPVTNEYHIFDLECPPPPP